ncbi:hypothetical protein AQUCO_01800173v1 [Aquilegia coerulea]|uniref:Glycosyl transferase 64 domain-containing protein n=1 Tax=Aquilegia coerulea TaxID=218851 RepID=A0A2G5DK88_AQUCA|nr:hypothetical protein AQUCO_01800173v1 [Aquilegia coerulea]
MRIFFFFFFFILLSLNSLVFSLRTLSGPCKTLNPNQRALRSDQITVLINGFSESRIHLLRSIASTYASFPSVDSVLILWGNTTTPLKTLTELSNNLTFYSFGAQISVLRQSTQSLNARFFPRPSITTRAVAICDDDVEIDRESFEFAFKIWSTHQESMIGFFARSHDFDLLKKSWIYSVHYDKYSILLTKFMILNTNYLYKYSCGSGSGSDNDMKMVKLRNVVDEMMNCEDILMNFVVSSEVSSGPILVDAKKLRDHGDSRNQNGEEGERDVGLSSRRREHRKRRGDCIREFHKVLGRMPLKYSYGKVVNSVGEQGLCEKGGKLVLCDEQDL